MKKRKHKVNRLPIYALALLFLGTALFLYKSQERQQYISKAAGDCTVSSAEMAMKPEEKQFLDAFNTYRAQNGRGPMVWASANKRAAQWLSNDMAKTNQASQIDSLGREPNKRLVDCGVNTTGYGEVAAQAATAAEALNTLKANPQNVLVMLDQGYSQIGIGKTGNYWAIDMSHNGANVNQPISPIAAPTTPVAIPSQNCLGSCPITPSPTPLPIDPVPSEIMNMPSEMPIDGAPTIDPLADPLIPGISLSPTPGATPASGGLLAIILQFFLMLIQLLLGS